MRWHDDVNADGDVDSNDPWFHFIYDERWRIVAVYRADTTSGDLDTDPKEQFIYHNAGLDGRGSSSYIDSVILRDRDTISASGGWADEAGDTLDERRYYCQNWRHDVVVIITDDGQMSEQVRYSAYGVPFGIPRGDVNGDGTVDGADSSLVLDMWGKQAGDPDYRVRADINLDGIIDSADHAIVLANWGATLGWDALSDDPDGSSGGLGNRKGYAGYEHDPALAGAWTLYHVRHRVYNADLGRWTRRDPLGYVDGMSLYEYVRSGPLSGNDPFGLQFGLNQDRRYIPDNLDELDELAPGWRHRMKVCPVHCLGLTCYNLWIFVPIHQECPKPSFSDLPPLDPDGRKNADPPSSPSPVSPLPIEDEGRCRESLPSRDPCQQYFARLTKSNCQGCCLWMYGHPLASKNALQSCLTICLSGGPASYDPIRRLYDDLVSDGVSIWSAGESI